MISGLGGDLDGDGDILVLVDDIEPSALGCRRVGFIEGCQVFLVYSIVGFAAFE